MRTYLGLAWASMRHRPGSWLLLALGVALAALLPVVSAGLRAESQVAAVQTVIEDLPAPQRAVLAVTSRDLRGEPLQSLNETVRSGLTSAGAAELRQLLVYRPITAAGQRISLGAASDLGSSVRVTEGRLPVSCRPDACEVLAVSLPGVPAAASYTDTGRRLGLVVTGRADLIDDRLIGTGLIATDTPMLLGHDPVAITELTVLDLFGRTSAWVGTLDGSSVARIGADQLTRGLADLSAAVNLIAGPLSISWPSDAVVEASDRAAASGDQLSVLGAGSGVLLLGFVLVAAVGMRRRQQLVARLLTRRGASPGQILFVMLLQPLLTVAVAVVAGLALGVAVVAVRGRALPIEPGSAVATTVPTLVGLALAALVLTVTVARWPEESSRTQLVADAALLAAVAGTVLLVSSGPVGGRLPASVVVLLTIATGLVAARLWRPVAALASRLSRARAPGWAVALTGGRRRPLLSMVTSGFVAAACSSLVFAGAYSQSLAQSALDQAAAQVPLDVRVGPSAQVAVPADVVDGAALRRRAPDVGVHPVVSSVVTAFAGSSLATALPLTGVDPEVWSGVHEFAAVTGSTVTPDDLARRLSLPDRGANGPVIPAGARKLAIDVTGINRDIQVGLWVSTPDGRERQLPLTATDAQLTANLEGGPALAVRGIELAETDSYRTHRQHAVGEGKNDRKLASGTMTFGGVEIDGGRVPWPWAAWNSNQATIGGASDTSIAATYRINETRVVLVPGTVGLDGGAAVPVAVDPATAARAGDRGGFGLTVNGQTVPVQIVAVLPRMPAVGPNFVVADRATVTALLSRTAPGTAYVSQVWISAPGASLDAVRQMLAVPPASTAAVSYRPDLAAAIRNDAVATRSIWLLGAAGALALLLAAVACATAVRANADESVADHLALELDGLGPRELRAVLLIRTGLALLLGVVVGVLGGVVLATVAVGLVVTGPGGTPVVPPLRVMIGAGTTLGVLAVALVLGGLGAGLAARTAFRSPLPVVPEVDLR